MDPNGRGQLQVLRATVVATAADQICKQEKLRLTSSSPAVEHLMPCVTVETGFMLRDALS